VQRPPRFDRRWRSRGFSVRGHQSSFFFSILSEFTHGLPLSVRAILRSIYLPSKCANRGSLKRPIRRPKVKWTDAHLITFDCRVSFFEFASFKVNSLDNNFDIAACPSFPIAGVRRASRHTRRSARRESERDAVGRQAGTGLNLCGGWRRECEHQYGDSNDFLIHDFSLCKWRTLVDRIDKRE
jgi:hypothetical protein